VADDAVRSETVSRPVLPAICDLQGDFQRMQGELVRFLSNFVIVSRCCKEFSLLREQGAFLVFAGKSSVELRMVAGLAQVLIRPRRRRSEGGVWRHPRRRNFRDCPPGRLHTVSLGIRGASGAGLRRQRFARYDDRDHPFRSIANQYDSAITVPSGVAAVPVVNRRDPRALRSASTVDAAAHAGSPC
jgi:hypothetical protein